MTYRYTLNDLKTAIQAYQNSPKLGFAKTIVLNMLADINPNELTNQKGKAEVLKLAKDLPDSEIEEIIKAKLGKLHTSKSGAPIAASSASTPQSTQDQKDNKEQVSRFSKLINFIKEEKYSEALELLKKMTCSELNEQDENENSALHWAVFKENTQLIKALAEKMSNYAFNLTNSENKTAVNLAKDDYIIEALGFKISTPLIFPQENITEISVAGNLDSFDDED